MLNSPTAFSRTTNLRRAHLDLLRDASYRLNADLQKTDRRAQVHIEKYRKLATELVAEGKALPPIPQEVRDLERERTALLIQHYVALRTALGSEGVAQLDAYLGHDFAPHLKLKRTAMPANSAQVPLGN